MAWPPPVLPISRTNADPQQNTHPNDHNALALAVNDTVAKLIAELPATIGPHYLDPGVAMFSISGKPDSGYSVSALGVLAITGYTSLTVNNDGARRMLVDASATWLFPPSTPSAWLTVGNSGVQVTGLSTQSNYSPPGDEWQTGNFVGYAPTGLGARIGLSNGSFSVQMRSYPNQQLLEILGPGGAGGLAYAEIGASAFTVGSTRATKRDIQAYDASFTPTTTSVPPDSDTVPPIDVMAFRPVTYRRLNPVMVMVPTGADPIDINDPDTFTYEPADGIVGAEGDRERLGLVAEDVETVLPSAVTHNQDGNAIGIDYAQVTVALLDHIQKLTTRVAALEGAAP